MPTKLEEALKALEKLYGKGSVLSASQKAEKMDVISTGSLGLDLATGIWGVPRGRIMEIIGPESSGKTTLCLHIIAEAQKKGLKAAYVDMEHALDLIYARRIGVDTDNLLISQPDYGEQALNIALTLAKTGEVGVIIIDSVAALVPKSEIDGEIGDASVGKQARMMSQGLRILSPIVEVSNTLIIFCNQIRMKIGGYGNPEVGAGGEALKYYASMRIDIRKTILKEEASNKVKCKIIKSKVAIAYKEAEFYIEWGIGIHRIREVFDLAVQFDIIEQKSSWITYKGEKYQGEANFIKMLTDNPTFLAEIDTLVMKKLYNEEEFIPHQEVTISQEVRVSKEQNIPSKEIIIIED